MNSVELKELFGGLRLPQANDKSRRTAVVKAPSRYFHFDRTVKPKYSTSGARNSAVWVKDVTVLMAMTTGQTLPLKFLPELVVGNRQNVLHWLAFEINSCSFGGVVSKIGGWFPPDEFLTPAIELQLTSNLSTTGGMGEICKL